MKTLEQNFSEKAITNKKGQRRPRVGIDDGISDRHMNMLIVFFTVCTVMFAFLLSATGMERTDRDSVKQRIELRQAILDVDRGEYIEAIPKLLKLVRSGPASAKANYLLGLCYLQGAGQPAPAAFYLVRAVTETSDDFEIWDLEGTAAPNHANYCLAQAYEMLGEYALAASYYRNFLNGDPQKLPAVESRTYAIINQRAAKCEMAALQQPNGRTEIVLLNR